MSDPDAARLRWIEHQTDEHTEEPEGPDTLDWEDR